MSQAEEMTCRTCLLPLAEHSALMADSCVAADERAPAIGDPPEGWQRPVRHYGPLNKATIPGHFSAKFVGVSFASAYPAILHRLAAQPERVLVLVREPQNEHDANAVAVMVDGGTKVLGHLPAGLAARIAPEMDAGAPWSIVRWEVLVMDGYEDRPGLSVEMERA